MNLLDFGFDFSHHRLFGLPLRPPKSAHAGDFSIGACTEICAAIDGNKEVGGRLAVLNIMKNAFPSCQCGDDFSHISEIKASLIKTYKSKSKSQRHPAESDFWKLENQSRPRVSMCCKECPGPINVEAIVSRARSNPNIISLCGVRRGQKEADFRSASVLEQEMHFVAFDIIRSPYLSTVDLSDNPLKDFGKLILAEAIRENATLKRLRIHHDPWIRTQADDPHDKIQEAKIHSFNYRMALSLFLKEFGVDTFPTRIIWEYLFGYDYIEICKPLIFNPELDVSYRKLVKSTTRFK